MPTLRLALAVVLASALSVPPAGADPTGAVRRLLEDPDAGARAAAVRRLAGDDSASAHRVLLDVLADAHPYVRRAAAGVLSGVVERRDALARAAAKLSSPLARAAAAEGVGLWLDEPAASLLARLLDDREPVVRAAALAALARPWRDAGAAEAGGLVTSLPEGWSADRVLAALDRAFADRDGGVRADALDIALGWRPERIGSARLRDRLGDPDPGVRLAALDGAVAGSRDIALEAVLGASKDEVWTLRFVAAEHAGAIRDGALLDRLIAWRDSEPRDRVVTAIESSLSRLTGLSLAGPEWTAWRRGDGASFDPATVDPDDRPAPRFAKGTHTVAEVRFLDVPIVSTHVAFVVDASASMREVGADGRRRDVRAREALGAALEGLARERRSARFNVHRFHDGVESLSPTSLPVGDATKRKAIAWLAAREPAGRTALFDGILAGLSDPEVDQVIVLSDGAPSAGSWFTKTDLLTEVSHANRRRRARIDVVTLGGDGIAARWRDLLKRIAAESGGVALAR